MGSIGAMRAGSQGPLLPGRRRRATPKLVPEGIEGRVPYRGPLSQSLYQLIGGLRVGHGLHRLPRRSTSCAPRRASCKITAAGLRESHVHDVIITKEAPNYRVE